MTYTLVNLVFLLPAAVLLWLAAVTVRRRDRHAARRLKAWALVGAGITLSILTVVFDNVMIAVGLYYYDGEHTSGMRIGAMPIEDLAYIVFAFLTLPALWELLRKEMAHEHG